MEKSQYIVREEPGFYSIVRLAKLRETPGVHFDCLPVELLPRIDAIDRVLHDQSAVSPGPVGEITRPWYMHPHQDDNLMVLYGTRYVDIFSVRHGRVESFEITPGIVKQNGAVVHDGPAMLVWPRNVFHRIVSGPEGSASVNFAVHYPGMDIKTNFNIYDLNPDTGKFKVIREGFRDQF